MDKHQVKLLAYLSRIFFQHSHKDLFIHTYIHIGINLQQLPHITLQITSPLPQNQNSVQPRLP